MRIRPKAKTAAAADGKAKSEAAAAELRNLKAEKVRKAAAAGRQWRAAENEAKQSNLEDGAPPGPIEWPIQARQEITHPKANTTNKALAVQAAARLYNTRIQLSQLVQPLPVSSGSSGNSRSRSPCRTQCQTPSPSLDPQAAKQPTGPPPFHLRIKSIVAMRTKGDKIGAQKEYASTLETIGKKLAEDLSEEELSIYIKSIVPGSRLYYPHIALVINEESESTASQTTCGP